MTYKNWTLERDDENIAWLCINTSTGSANTLSAETLTELDSVLEALEANNPEGLVLYSGKETSFIMGADINEFVKIRPNTRRTG